MSAGFTPGPWTVTTCNEGEDCWCRIISCPATEGSDGNDWVIASGAAHKRDAHLIAAAPDLYAVLDEAIGANRCVEDPDWWGRAFAAVRKARGEA